MCIQLDEIGYFSAEQNYCRCHLKDESIHLIRVNIGNLEEELDEYEFLRTHRGYLVNLNEVNTVNVHQRLCRVGETSIPVSRRKLPRVRQAVRER